MKKRSVIILGLLILAFVVTTVRAAGTAPPTYNSDAKALLEMLWAKLDEAIVSNYNVSMLVRYHDHAGTNPGDFTSRGLPINSGGITNGAVTATKLSTAAKKHSNSVRVGTLNALTEGYYNLAIVPGNGTFTGVGYLTANTVAQNDTDYTTLSIWRIRSGVWLTEIVKNTKATGGMDIIAYRPVRLTTGLSNTDYQAGDAIVLSKSDAGAGRQLSDLVVNIEYTVSE